MKRYFAILCVLSSGAAMADSTLDSNMRDILSSNASEKGQAYQLAKRCGATPDILANFEKVALASYELMKDSYKELKIDFNKLYADGKNQGDKTYNQLGKDADSSPTCKEAIETASCKGTLGVLSC